MKCSFCEQPLVCKTCDKPFHPADEATHLGPFQADMEVTCPACQAVLVCKLCGYRYGEEDEEIEA